ncbi:MAG: hypothetical protein GXY83_23810 [Rhodopirellula sp.]|nr:hypothetical protein [Rhodopirellula sp.]
MGQVRVASVQVESLPEVWTALGRAGFAVTVPEPGDRVARCRRADRELVVGIGGNKRDAAEAFLLVAYPPYSVWPWRWSGDVRSFDDLTAVLDEFHFRD